MLVLDPMLLEVPGGGTGWAAILWVVDGPDAVEVFSS